MKEQPLLFIDVDGVLSTYGFAGEDADPRNLRNVDGILHHIRREMGPRILALLPHFESVWATGWGERANEHLVLMLGMPDELEVIEFAVAPSTDGSGHWKLDSLTERAGTRPSAWIDDGHNEACERWAAERVEPTLLVSTDPYVGLTDEHVKELIAWSTSINAL
ncbi:MAG: HAD domain-containing protein [Solirubrobacterales bacterium]